MSCAPDRAISVRAKVISAELNRRGVPFRVAGNDQDQHVIVRVASGTGASTLRIRVRDDFGVSYRSQLPQLGSESEGLRIISESWTPSRDKLTLSVSGIAGRQYELSAWNASQVSSVDGAALVREGDGSAKLRVAILANDGRAVGQPAQEREHSGRSNSAGPRAQTQIVLHFAAKRGREHSEKR